MSNRSIVLKAYRESMRAAQGMTNYNFREYFIRRTRESFKERKTEMNSAKVEEFLKTWQKTIDMMNRQKLISQLYRPDRPYYLEEKRSGKIV
jgi:LYR motif-containing protein 4